MKQENEIAIIAAAANYILLASMEIITEKRRESLRMARSLINKILRSDPIQPCIRQKEDHGN